MKIAISAAGNNLDARTDPRFGRAAYFLIIDSDTMDFTPYLNPNIEATGGAGIQAAQFVLEKGAKAVITGSCGPNAYRVLQAAGIPVFEATDDSVRNLLKKFQEKRLINIDKPGRGGLGKSGGRGREGNNLQSAHPGSYQPEKTGAMNDKINQIEDRLQEINHRLEELENRQGKNQKQDENISKK